MPETWMNFFGLEGDPFAQRALQTDGDFQYLLVKTDDIVSYIDPLIEHFDKSDAFLRVIEGERGTGKTTIMHYTIQKLHERALAAYVPYQYASLEGYKDPKYGVGADTLLQITLALTRRLDARQTSPKIKEQIESVFSALGVNPETGIQEKNPPPYGVIEGRLNEILDIIRDEKLKALVAVDNYDRLPKDVAIDFWKSNFAQGPLADRLVAAGVSVLFSARTGWIPRVGEDPDLSYLGEPIRILPLNDLAAKELLTRRYQNKAKDGANFPLADEAILEVTKRMNGVPRFILETTRSCLIEAARKRAKVISAALAIDLMESLGERQERYYEAIEDDPSASRGYGILHSLRERVEPEKYPVLLSALGSVYAKKEVPNNLLELLRANGIVWLEPSQKDMFETRIASQVESLLNKIKT